MLNSPTNKAKSILTLNDDLRTFEVFKVEFGVNFVFSKDNRVFTMNCVTKSVEQDTDSIIDALHKSIQVEFKKIENLKSSKSVPTQMQPVNTASSKK